MKKWLSMTMAWLLAVSAGGAQEFIAPFERETPTPVVPIPGPQRPTIEGIVAEIFNVKKPWQLVNPLAPAEYGNGESTVSRDPNDPEKPKGFIVFGIKW